MAFRALRVFLLTVLLSGQAPVTAAQEPAQKNSPATTRVKLLLLPVRVVDMGRQRLEQLLPVVKQELDSLGIFTVVDANGDNELAQRANKLLKKSCLRDVICTRQVAVAFSADVLLAIHAEQSVQGITFTMSTLDGSTGRQVRQASDFASAQDEDQQRAMRWLTRMVASPILTVLGRERGNLEIACEAGGAVVFLNGKRFELNKQKKFRLAPGAFDVVVQAKDYSPFHDVVVVRPGEIRKLKIDLQPLPGTRLARLRELQAQAEKKKQQPVKTKKKEPPRFYQTWWFWTIVGVVAAGAAGTTTYFLLSGGPSGQGQVAATWR